MPKSRSSILYPRPGSYELLKHLQNHTWSICVGCFAETCLCFWTSPCLCAALYNCAERVCQFRGCLIVQLMVHCKIFLTCIYEKRKFSVSVSGGPFSFLIITHGTPNCHIQSPEHNVLHHHNPSSRHKEAPETMTTPVERDRLTATDENAPSPVNTSAGTSSSNGSRETPVPPANTSTGTSNDNCDSRFISTPPRKPTKCDFRRYHAFQWFRRTRYWGVRQAHHQDGRRSQESKHRRIHGQVPCMR